MKKPFAILFILLFSFCSKRSPYPHLIVPEKENAIDVNTKSMLLIFPSGNQPFAYDFKEDVVMCDTFDWKKLDKYYPYFKNADTVFPKYDFKIIVDTSYTIPARGFIYKGVKLPLAEDMIEDGMINGKRPTYGQIKKQDSEINRYYDSRSKLQRNYVNCFPLLLFNNGKTAAYIKRSRLIQEAKDRDGIWKPIEFIDSEKGCFVNHRFFKFNPKTYNAQAIIKYHGDFKTKLRVKMEINKKYYYSNEFNGSINQSQFNQDYLKKYIDYSEGSYGDNDFKDKYRRHTLLQYIFDGD